MGLLSYVCPTSYWAFVPPVPANYRAEQPAICRVGGLPRGAPAFSNCCFLLLGYTAGLLNRARLPLLKAIQPSGSYIPRGKTNETKRPTRDRQEATSTLGAPGTILALLFRTTTSCGSVLDLTRSVEDFASVLQRFSR
jgi:hypothetical protein